MGWGEGKSFMVGGVNGMGERKSFLWWMAEMGWEKESRFMVDGGDGMGEESRFKTSWW